MACDDSVVAIEIAYALPDRQVLIAMEVRAGTTVGEAVVQSGLSSAHKGMDVKSGKFGIFGKRVSPDDVIKNGDRIEIYRPLTADPKDARRRRARKSV